MSLIQNIQNIQKIQKIQKIQNIQNIQNIQKKEKKLKIVYNLCDIDKRTFFLEDLHNDLEVFVGGDINTRISNSSFYSFLTERALMKVNSFNNNKQDFKMSWVHN